MIIATSIQYLHVKQKHCKINFAIRTISAELGKLIDLLLRLRRLCSYGFKDANSMADIHSPFLLRPSQVMS